MATNFIKYRDKEPIILQRLDMIESMSEKLSPGFYSVDDVSGPFSPLIFGFTPILLKENLIKFKTGTISQIMKKCTHFFSSETKTIYDNMGVSHKMAAVLYGPPGTGKTCTAQLIMSELSEKFDALCIDFTGYNANFIRKVCKEIRNIQNNPIVMFFDEAEKKLREDEQNFLSFLDGIESVDNSIFLACTNFFNKIPKRIRERRSRVKIAIEIKSLPTEIYEDYIKTKVPTLSHNQMKKFAFLAEDKCLTIDELKHAVIDFCVDGATMEEAIMEVKNYTEQEDW